MNKRYNEKSEILVAEKNHSMKAEEKIRIVGDKCILNDVYILKDNKTIIKGKKQENELYVVNFQTQKEGMLTETIKNVELWYRKVGYLSITYIKKLVDISQGINTNKADCNILYKNYKTSLQAKQVRFPFSSKGTRAKRPGFNSQI